MTSIQSYGSRRQEFRFHYRAEKTPARFHKSNAFIRGIRGPYGCNSADHEVMTRTGWVRMDRWTGEEILVVDPENKRSWFESVSRVVADCDAFIHLKSRGLDIMASDEHLIPYFVKSKPGVLRQIRAAGLAFQHQHLKDGWPGLIPCCFPPPENALGLGLNDAELRVMVMVCADGSFSHRTKTTRCTVCVRRSDKKLRVRQLLVMAGIAWSEYDNQNRPTETTFRFEAPERNKSLAKYWQASAAQLKIIAAECLRWDGSEDQGYGDWGYYTTDRACAEFVAYAFSACGRRASVGTQEGRRPGWSRSYRVIGSSRGYAGIRNGSRKIPVERVPAVDGKKYCFHTSTGFFVTRRNDSICVTGNSGKSVACVAEIALRAVQQEPDDRGIRRTRWGAIRNTYPELESTTIFTFLSWFGEDVVNMNWGAPIEATIKLALDDGTIMHLEVLFMSCDRPAAIGKLKSLDLTGLWLNEAGELDKLVLDDGSARVGRFPLKKDGAPFTWAGVIMDTNSMDDDHWWHDLDVGPDDEERGKEIQEMMAKLRAVLASIGVHRPLIEFFDQPPALLKIDGSYFPNPEAENVVNQPMGMAYWLQLVAGKSEDWISTYLLNNYGKVIDGVPCYPEFNQRIHGEKRDLTPISGMPIDIGLDFGLSPAAVPGQCSPKGQLLVLGECCARERSMGLRAFLSDALKPYLANRFGVDRRYRIVCDPQVGERAQSNEVSCADILDEGHWEWEKAKAYEFQPRREAVAWFLTKLTDGEPAILIDSSAKTLLKGFKGGYHYRRIQVTGEARYQNEAYKNRYSHCFVADTLVATPDGDVPIDSINVGDMVLTHKGARRVSATMNRISNNLVAVRFSNCVLVCCTADHEFILERGRVRADELQYGDVLQTIAAAQWEDQERTKPLSLTLARIIASLKDITVATIDSAARICTGIFGSITMGQYLTGSTFITATKIKTTTRSKIFTYLATLRTRHIIQENASEKILRRQNDTCSIALSRRQGNGTLATKEDVGMQNRQSAYGAIDSQWREFAGYAKNDMLPLHRRRGIARQPVSQRRDAIQESTTRNEPVQSADQLSKSIATRAPEHALTVVGVKPCPGRRERVYDLTVDDAHTFYANGVLVSNCHDGLQYLALKYVTVESVGAMLNTTPQWQRRLTARGVAGTKPWRRRGGRL